MLITILSDGNAVNWGPLYKDVQLPQTLPPFYPEVKMYITNNQLNNCTLYNSNVGCSVNALQVNKILDFENSEWNIDEKDGFFELTPFTRKCCVKTDHCHSEDKHSRIYVRKTSVIATCFSHGKRSITGEQSRKLREIFFDFMKSTSVLGKTFEDVLSKAESEKLFRSDGYVFRHREHDEPELISSYEDFLMDHLEDNTDIMEMPRRFNELMISMSKLKSVRFPFVKRDKKYLGFSNGFLDLVDGELTDDIGNDRIPRHYVNQPFQLEDLDTPLFDRIVMHQLED